MSKAILCAAVSGALFVAQGCLSSADREARSNARNPSDTAEPATTNLQQVMDSAREATPKYRSIEHHCQEAAARFLEQTDADDSIPFLITRLTSYNDTLEQWIAMHALIIQHDERARQPMQELLEHSDPNVVQKARRVLDALKKE